MNCDFIEYKWSGWYCIKDKKIVDKATVNLYCTNSLAWRKCPIYKKKPASDPCYLTTAMCDVLGKDDNCKELETLRSFRDNYMKNDEEYSSLLDDYDLVGPMISDKILDDENCEYVANVMKNTFIDPSIEYIEEGKTEDAVDTYVDMTLELMKHYDIDRYILTSPYYKKFKEKTRNRK